MGYPVVTHGTWCDARKLLGELRGLTLDAIGCTIGLVCCR